MAVEDLGLEYPTLGTNKIGVHRHNAPKGGRQDERQANEMFHIITPSVLTVRPVERRSGNGPPVETEIAQAGEPAIASRDPDRALSAGRRDSGVSGILPKMALAVILLSEREETS